jgi:hypothetical protein
VMIAVVAVPGPSEPDAEPLSPDGSAPAATATPAPAAVTADDPLEALAQLLRRREDCLRDLSLLCLDDVDEQGSSALDDDRRAVRAVLDAGESPPRVTSEGAVVVERLGDSVLIELGPDSDPASVLLMKGEAGWRVRDYLAD